MVRRRGSRHTRTISGKNSTMYTPNIITFYQINIKEIQQQSILIKCKLYLHVNIIYSILFFSTECFRLEKIITG